MNNYINKLQSGQKSILNQSLSVSVQKSQNSWNKIKMAEIKYDQHQLLIPIQKLKADSNSVSKGNTIENDNEYGLSIPIYDSG